MSRDNIAKVSQISFVKLLGLSTVLCVLAVLAAAEHTTTSAESNSAPKRHISTARIAADRQVPDNSVRITASFGGEAPTLQATRHYINPTYLTEHITNGFDSSGGDLLVVYASSHDNVMFSPSDNYGNAWVSIAGPSNTTQGFDLRSQIWYVPHPKVGPGHTVTLRLSKKQPLVISVFVVKGSDAQAPIQAVSEIGSDSGRKSLNVSSPPVSTTRANELLLGWAKVSAGASFKSGKNFLQQNDASSDFLDAESETDTAPGTHRAAFTISASQTWQSAVVAIAPKLNQATLRWSPASPESEYLIERCGGKGCDKFQQVAVTTKHQYIDTNLKSRTSYSYRIRERDREGKLGEYSHVAPLTLFSACPPLPESLSATAVSPTKIRLSWLPSSDQRAQDRYLIERCFGGACSNFSLLANTTRANFTDSGLLPGATYTYRVRTLDHDGYCSPALCVAKSTTILSGNLGFVALFGMASVAPWHKRARKLFD